ncbi:MAG TPA: aldo/keto reductase, partial [Anaerohalosphaeraceae bacterium]|nr:aldo/keto reductase [Anaerohalosphaeraceae bacterium]
SMLRRTFETAGLFETLEELGIGAICFSPLAQGLLTDKYLQGIPADSRAAKPHGYLKKESVTPDLIQKITQLNRLAQQRGQTLAQMALAWVLSRKTVTSALIGTSRLEQLLDNLKTLENLCFSEEQLRQIEAVLNA